MSTGTLYLMYFNKISCAVLSTVRQFVDLFSRSKHTTQFPDASVPCYPFRVLCVPCTDMMRCQLGGLASGGYVVGGMEKREQKARHQQLADKVRSQELSLRALRSDVTNLRRRLRTQAESLAKQKEETEALTRAAEEVCNKYLLRFCFLADFPEDVVDIESNAIGIKCPIFRRRNVYEYIARYG